MLVGSLLIRELTSPDSRQTGENSTMNNDLSVSSTIEVVDSSVASDVMTVSLRTCSKFSQVIEAVLILKEEERGIVPVIEEGKPIGVVTDRDVVAGLATIDDLVTHPIAEIMTTKLVSVSPTTPLAQVVEILERESLGHLLVVNSEGLLVGVIGWKDVRSKMPPRVMGEVLTDIAATTARN